MLQTSLDVQVGTVQEPCCGKLRTVRARANVARNIGRSRSSRKNERKDQQIAALQAAAEAREGAGGTSAEFDLESDGGMGVKWDYTRRNPILTRGAARLLRKLGNKGLSFYQANVHRNARRSRIMRIQQMNKQSDRRDESNDKLVLRSSLEQLGIQRAKLLAQGEKNDAVYPHLETLWSRSIGKQIMVRLPPPHHSKYGKDADEDADLFQQDSDKEEDLVERLSQTGEQNEENHRDERKECDDREKGEKGDSVAAIIKRARRKKKIMQMRAGKTNAIVDLKTLENDLMSRTKDLINLYLNDENTVS